MAEHNNQWVYVLCTDVLHHLLLRHTFVYVLEQLISCHCVVSALQLPDKEEVEAARKAAEEHRQHLAAVREAAAKSNTGEGMHKVRERGGGGGGPVQ
jgi:hypothetical protein